MTPIKADDVKIGDIIRLKTSSRGGPTKSLYLAVDVNNLSHKSGISFMCLVSTHDDKQYRCRIDSFSWWVREDLYRLGNIYEGNK